MGGRVVQKRLHLAARQGARERRALGDSLFAGEALQCVALRTVTAEDEVYAVEFSVGDRGGVGEDQPIEPLVDDESANSGDVPQRQLHFDRRVRGIYVDPIPYDGWIDRAEAGEVTGCVRGAGSHCPGGGEGSAEGVPHEGRCVECAVCIHERLTVVAVDERDACLLRERKSVRPVGAEALHIYHLGAIEARGPPPFPGRHRESCSPPQYSADRSVGHGDGQIAYGNPLGVEWSLVALVDSPDHHRMPAADELARQVVHVFFDAAEPRKV